MLKQFKLGVMLVALALLSACGFHFQNQQILPEEIQTLRLETVDPYSEISQALRRQLQLRNVQLLEEKRQNVAILRINNTRTNSSVASVFKQGREAEKLLILTVEASLILPNQPAYPMTAHVSRAFFDNSRAALAKSAEQESIWQDMYSQAANQLIIKMTSIVHKVKH